MKMLRHLFATVLLLLSSLAHSFTILPMDGLWGIVNEQQLAVGRAMNLEMGGSVLVVTMYAYNAQGAPTFYVGGATLSATNVSAITLSEPQGGTCLGCPLTSGRLLSSPGVATFEFTSSTTGFVTLPGEARKAIIKGDITRPVAPDGLLGVWAFTYYIDAATQIADVPFLTQKTAATSTGNGVVVSSNGLLSCELQTSGSRAGYVLCIKAKTNGTLERYSVSKIFGNRMDGNWYTTVGGTASFFTAHRFIDGTSNDLSVKRATETNNEAIRNLMESVASEVARLPQ